MLFAPSDNAPHEDKALPKRALFFYFKNEKKLTLTYEKNREKKLTLTLKKSVCYNKYNKKCEKTKHRKNNQITTFGKFLDPLADKILVLAAMTMLVEMTKLPAWIPIIVLTREFMVSGYRLVAVEKGGKVIAASKWGKLKTVTQMIAIILAFVDLNPFGECFLGTLQGGDLILNIIVTGMMIIQTIATIFSGLDYMKGAKKLMKD